MSLTIKNKRGQGTVEAAFLIPVLLLLMMMLLQPGIILYDHIVMAHSASEACRLLATSSDVAGEGHASCEAFVRHRLSAIPQHDCFHVHNEECSWVIEFSGDESSEFVTVRIATELKPLPLFDALSRALGVSSEKGTVLISESVTAPTQAAWVGESTGASQPAEWPGAWL